jgi:transcriptional regulator with XRE-family HTH domain
MSIEIKLDEYEQFLKTLGCRIKQLRNERGYSLRDMVIRFGYNDSQWRRYERGGSINVQSLLKIAKAFEVSLSKLLDGLGEYPAESMPEIKKRLAAPANKSSSKKTKTI